MRCERLSNSVPGTLAQFVASRSLWNVEFILPARSAVQCSYVVQVKTENSYNEI